LLSLPDALPILEMLNIELAHAEGAENRGHRRHHHVPDADEPCDRSGMQGPTAAIGHQRRSFRPRTPPAQEAGDSRGDSLVHGASHAPRELGGLEPELAPELLEHFLRKLPTELEPPAVKAARIEKAEGEIGVGDGRLLAASVEACGARMRTGAL